MPPAPLVPAVVARKLDAVSGPSGWLRLVGGLHQRRGFFWLDSAQVGARLGRTSFAGAEPWAVSRVRGRRIETQIHRAREAAPPPQAEGDALDAVRALLPPRLAAATRLPVPFAGGVVAVVGYEAGDVWEDLPPAPFEADRLPDATLLAVDRVYAYDHLEGVAWALALEVAETAAGAQRRAEEAAQRMLSPLPQGTAPPCPAADRPAPIGGAGGTAAGPDAAGHAKAVQQILDGIAAGNLYQACLTHRISVPFRGDPWCAYGALRRSNPAPFAAYLALPDATLVGSSPERFLQITPGGWLESRPIKGTRPLGADAERDRALRAELDASAKDRAENVMIVDLVRNDLGRVAEPGSVHVPEWFHIEPHPAVFQGVSTVRARLGPGRDALDAVKACFPPGSMTGAPKLAAMSLLRALEPTRRGPYAGALGYFDVRGSADLSVVIRTAIVRNGRADVHTGGGIVADSDAAEEWREAATKARALLDALAAAEGTVPRP